MNKKLVVGIVGVSLFCAVSGVGADDEEPAALHTLPDSRQTYYLHIPQGYTSDRKWPLFVFIHGESSSGLGTFNMWRPYADQEGFILLAPNFTGEDDRFLNAEDRTLLTS